MELLPRPYKGPGRPGRGATRAPCGAGSRGGGRPKTGSSQSDRRERAASTNNAPRLPTRAYYGAHAVGTLWRAVGSFESGMPGIARGGGQYCSLAIVVRAKKKGGSGSNACGSGMFGPAAQQRVLSPVLYVGMICDHFSSYEKMPALCRLQGKLDFRL